MPSTWAPTLARKRSSATGRLRFACSLPGIRVPSLSTCSHAHRSVRSVAGRISGMDTIQYNLPQDRIPRAWYNIAADLPPLFPMELIKQEVSTEREIEIPDPVRQVYAQWRPSPLFRARRLEKALDTPAKIYYKYEGVSAAGSHQPHTE